MIQELEMLQDIWGLIKSGDKDVVLYIKIVPCPAGGYIGTVKNEIGSSSNVEFFNGYIFVTEQGEEIKLPVIREITTNTEEDGKIKVTVDAVSYNSDTTIEEYYFGIDNASTTMSTYTKSETGNEFTFENVQAHKAHTINVYVKDSKGFISNTSTVITKTGDALIEPTIEIVDEEKLIAEGETIEYDGKVWFPYGTQIKINYAEDMTNLTGYFKTINTSTGVESVWNPYSGAYYPLSLYESITYVAKLADSTGAETKEVSKTIYIMPCEAGLQSNYVNYCVGQIFPVKVAYSSSGNLWGTDTYKYNSYISKAATHLGLVKSGETKNLFIKVVESPVGGYKASTKNGISSTVYANSSEKGYIFVIESGEEYRSPKVESAVTVSGENEISVTVAATANLGEITEYYYSIDNGTYNTSDNNTYTFKEVQAFKNHTINVYVKDSNGLQSEVTSVICKTSNTIPKPTIKILNEENIETIEYDGKTWYPYGTQIQIDYSTDMTNLSAIYQYTYYEDENIYNWGPYGNSSAVVSMTESGKITAKIQDSLGNQSEETVFEFYVMANPGRLQDRYINYGLGKIYPVQVAYNNNTYNIYGTDVYTANSNNYTSIIAAARHIGLVRTGETKDLFIKVVESPEGGYKSSTKNGMTSRADSSNAIGYIFVTEDGKEIKAPTLNSLTAVGGTNSIDVSVQMNYTNAQQCKYYYKIDNGEYIEEKSNTHTFNENIALYGEHTIYVYAVDTNGATSEVYTTTARPSNEVPKPKIEAIDVDESKIVEYDGKTWYPYNTKVRITYADDMTNLIGNYKTILESTKTESNWINNGTAKTYDVTITETTTFIAKNINGSEETLSDETTIYIMPGDESNYLQYNYTKYCVGQIFPVKVIGSTAGTINGTDIYIYNSNISRAAMHMGLIEEGQEKTLYIKVVNAPSDYFKASMRNGIQSYDNYAKLYNAYTFVTESGEPIKANGEFNTPPMQSTNTNITMSLSNGPEYTDKNGKQWYSRGTKLTINYTGSGKYQYIVIDNNTGSTSYYPSSGSANSEVELTVDRTSTIIARILDSNTVISENTMELYIMGDALSIGYYCTQYGIVCPVKVTATSETVKNETAYGTNTYWGGSSVNLAAMHMGLLKEGETKILYIKGYSDSNASDYYPGSLRNGVSTNTRSVSSRGSSWFIFVDENGKPLEAIEENPLTNVKATLSGYDVLSENTNYYFINDGTSVVPNKGITNGTVNSYIEIDLTEHPNETYKVILNAEVSSEANCDIGCAVVTNTTSVPSYNGGFVAISGEIEAKDYTTVLKGGKKYYLHLGYSKDRSRDTGKDQVRFNSLRIEACDIANSTITIDPTVEPIIYKGEKWFPHGTKVTINRGEELTQYYYKLEYHDNVTQNSGYQYVTSSNTEIILTQTVTIKTGYTNECDDYSEKINIMPYSFGGNSSSTYFDAKNIGRIYPVQVTYPASFSTRVGTNTYRNDSCINTTAVHMGLLKEGETKTLYIKVVPFPEGGFKGTRRNNVTTGTVTTSAIGYVFVDEDGNELEPISLPNATLSGYDVYANNTYYFEQAGDSVVSNNKDMQDTTANSYIEIDLSNKSKNSMFRVVLNAETSCNYYGYAHLNTSKEVTNWNGSASRMFYKNGITEPQNYETVIPGGQIYYLHLGYYRNGTSSIYEDVVKFHALDVTEIETTDIPKIEVDPTAEYVMYKGEKWYPYGTKVKVIFGEQNHIATNNYNTYNYIKANGEMTGSKGNYGAYNVGIYEFTVYETTTYYAKYSLNSKEEAVLKVNIMPDVYGNSSYNGYYANKLGEIYPVRVFKLNTTVYGTEKYLWNSGCILGAATHMGLVNEDPTIRTTRFIKVIESPEGGYKGSTKNGFTSTSSTSTSNGFIFVEEDGTEILEPIINNATATIESENTILATINAEGKNAKEVTNYYYSIDNGPYIESSESTYTFTDIEAYKTHTVRVYVKDNKNIISQTKEITTNVVGSSTPPRITLSNEPIVLSNGEEWYPNGTKVRVDYAGDMTNLQGYYRSIDERTGNIGGWSYTTGTYAEFTLTYSSTYIVKTVNKSTGKETEEVRKTIRIMPDTISGPTTYYGDEYLGNIYPVKVTKVTSGNVWGTDTYYYGSNINLAATHMGLVTDDNPEALVYIKIVKAPTGAYIGSTRNGVTTSAYHSYNGYMFVDENGNEIARPKINSVTTTSGENEITVTIDANSAKGNIAKYYYSIDNGEYTISNQKFYTFKNVKISGNRVIKIYVEDEFGGLSPIKEVNGYRNTPTPSLVFDKEPITYNGEKWYPYGTIVSVKYSESMNGSTLYYRTTNVHTKVLGSWSNWSGDSNLVSMGGFTESVIYEAYNYNAISGESEHIREKINIMANPDSLQGNYYSYGSGNIYPVQVTGKTGSGYGTDTYCAYSRYYTPIGVAAVHKGLLQVGETKTLYIQIVPCPEGGYIGSTRNGITTSNLGSAYIGYTFVQ